VVSTLIKSVLAVIPAVNLIVKVIGPISPSYNNYYGALIYGIAQIIFVKAMIVKAGRVAYYINIVDGLRLSP
jgi:hypothetical protein